MVHYNYPGFFLGLVCWPLDRVHAYSISHHLLSFGLLEHYRLLHQLNRLLGLLLLCCGLDVAIVIRIKHAYALLFLVDRAKLHTLLIEHPSFFHCLHLGHSLHL